MHLFFGLSLGDIVTTDFDARLEESLGHVSNTKTEQVGNLLCHSVVWQCSLIRITVLFKLHVSKEERS